MGIFCWIYPGGNEIKCVNSISSSLFSLFSYEERKMMITPTDALNTLHGAIEEEALEAVLDIISKDGNLVNRVLINHTALTLATELGVRCIIEAVMTSDNLDVNATDRFGRPALYFAFKSCQISLARTLISRGADVNLSKPPLLHGCCYGGSDTEDVVYELVELGVDVNVVDERNRTALHIAVQNSLFNIAKALLKCKANVNAVEGFDFQTPLMICAGKSPISIDDRSKEEYHRSLKVLKLLLDSGADISAKDDKGRTAIHIALQNANILASSLLIHWGAKHDSLNSNTIRSAYEISLLRNCLEMACIIFFNFYRHFETFPLNFYSNAKETLQNIGKKRQNEYVLALEQSLTDLCTRHYCQEVSAKGPLGFMQKLPKLQNLCRHTILRNLNLSVFENTCIKLPTAKTLQDFIFYNTRFSIISTLSLSDIHIATHMGDLESLALRLNPHIVNIPFNGLSLLEVAISRQCIPGTNLLLENGADPNGETKEGFLPLHLASRQCCFEIVQILLKFGGNVNALDKQGNLPIHEACVSGHFNIAELLMQHGSIYHHPDTDGRYPIHYSCASGNWHFTNVLIKLGIDGDTTDKCGYTGLHLAASRGNLYLIQNIELPYLFETELLMKGYMFVLMYSCNVRCVTKPKYTPQVNHIKVLENLMTAGCNHAILSNKNKSALDIARDYGFTDIMTTLQRR